MYIRRNTTVATAGLCVSGAVTSGVMFALGYPLPALLAAVVAATLALALAQLMHVKRRQLDAIMSSIGEGILVYDGDDCLLGWNKAACDLAGIDPEALRPGLSHRELVAHLYDRGEFGEERTEAEVMSELGSRPQAFDGVRRRPNGRYLRIRRNRTSEGCTVVVLNDVTDVTLAEEWLNTTNEELEQRVQERIAELNGAMEAMQTEIARRKEAEEWLLQLNAQNNVLAAVIEADASAVVIADATKPEMPIIYVNPAFTEITGYTAQDSIGQSPRLLDGPETDRSDRLRVIDAIAKGEAATVDIRHYRKSGEPFWSHLSIFPVRNKHGQITHYVGSITDVTQHREAQQESARLHARMAEMSKFEALGTLAGGVAHEINTPIQYVGDNVRFLQSAFSDVMSVVEAYGGALSGEASARETLAERLKAADLDFLTAEVPQAIGQCLDGIGRVSRIVQAIKEFSHPSAKQAAPFDLNHAVETAVTVSRNQWKYVAEVSLDLDPDLPHVTGDQGEINQVLLNMIVNAAHAIEEAGRGAQGEIGIATRLIGHNVELSIRDSGIGIPADKRQKIFEMFYTTKPPGKGTGQGLAICHTIIVQRHGGSIAVDSEYGAGTCFRVLLPIDGIAQAKAA